MLELLNDNEKFQLMEATQNFKRLEVKKNTFLLKPGETENFVYYVSEGLVRVYLEKNDGEESTMGFYTEGDFVSGYPSFLSQKPSLFGVQVLEDSVLIQGSREQINDLYYRFPLFEKFGRLAIEKNYIKITDHYVALLTTFSEERYLKLFKENPDLINRVPVKHLATFLGIHPNSLSRIRKKI